MSKDPTPQIMRQAELNLLAAQTARFNEYRSWVGFRLWILIIMTAFLILLEGYRIVRVSQLVQTCVKIVDVQP